MVRQLWTARRTVKESSLRTPAVGDRQGGVPPEWQPRFSGRQVRKARLMAKQRTAAHSQVQRARLALLLYPRLSMPSAEAGRRLGQSPGGLPLAAGGVPAGRLAAERSPARLLGGVATCCLWPGCG